MPCVSKCCCCCSLKYGYLAYGTICLILRICAIFTIYLMAPAAYMISARNYHDSYYGTAAYSSIFGYYIGWFLGTAAALFIALKGIIERRSILLYPYIVVLIFEIIATIILSIYVAVAVSPWVLIQFIFIAVFNIYPAICLVSLYQRMKQNEKAHPIIMDSVGFKTVV